MIQRRERERERVVRITKRNQLHKNEIYISKYVNFALWRQYYIVNSNGQAQVSVLSLISTMNQN